MTFSLVYSIVYIDKVICKGAINMAFFTAKTRHGCCAELKVTPDGVHHIAPEMDKRHKVLHTENAWILFYAKVEGEKGESVKCCLNWPEYDKAKNLSDDEWTKNLKTFSGLVPNLIYISEDELSWTRVEEIKTDGNKTFFDVTVPNDKLFISVGLPYTAAMLGKLRTDMLDSPWVTEEIIGYDAFGFPLTLYTVTDNSVDINKKKAVWYQAVQHAPETAGATLADAMLRFLSGDTKEAEQIRKETVFHILPVCSVNSWLCGQSAHESGINPNRDWVNKELPETRAIVKYIDKIAKSENLTLAFDVHTGLAFDANPHINVSKLSLSTNKPPEMRKAEQETINDILENCNHFGTEPIWEYEMAEREADGYIYKHYCQAHTIEICRFNYFDKKSGSVLPPSQEAFTQFGCDFCKALAKNLRKR